MDFEVLSRIYIKLSALFPVVTCCEAAEGCDAGPLGVVAGEVLRVVLAAGLVHRHRVRTHGDHRALTWHTGTVSSGAKENRDSNEGYPKVRNHGEGPY